MNGRQETAGGERHYVAGIDPTPSPTSSSAAAIHPAWLEPGTCRLVATDLDGTLLGPDGLVSARAAAAARALRAAGIHVVPVTGRPPQATWDIARVAGLGPFGVCSNGAAVVDLVRGRVSEVDALPGPVAADLIAAIRRAVPGILLAIDDLDHFRFEPQFFPVDADWEEQLSEVGDIAPHAATGCIKLIARRPGLGAPELMALLEAEVADRAGLTTSGLDWVDLGPPGVSKASALARVCGRMGITAAEVIAVGDNYNDLSVLAWAGLGLAPANAIPAVVDIVDGLIPSHADDGVAQLLEALVPGANRCAAQAPGR